MRSPEEEIEILCKHIKRLGATDGNGKCRVKFGILFRDDDVANTLEALLGTLKAAKKRKILTFEGELLLQGVHDQVEIILLV